MPVQQGDAFALKINSSNAMWNGEICTNPYHYRCGSPDQFRHDFCSNGIKRCHQIGVFEEGNAKCIYSDRSLYEFLKDNPNFLDDQILFFYGQNYSLEWGRVDGIRSESLYGAYRVKGVSFFKAGTLDCFAIEPYQDSWAIFPRNTVKKPFTKDSVESVHYLKQISAQYALDAVVSAKDSQVSIKKADALSPALVRRLREFSGSLEGWLKTAKQKMSGMEIKRNKASFSATSAISPGMQLAMDMKQGKVIPIVSIPVTADDAAPAVVDPAWQRPSLPEAECVSQIERNYDENLVLAIQMGTRAKNKILFVGPTGVGKTHLAAQLINDPQRERSVVIPVGSTWRNTSDLLGYVNPVSGEFEPTPCTLFLRKAEKAWKNGDRRIWLIRFEEYNLSQPEHWFSDLLVLTSMKDDADRILHLGGRKIAGEPDGMSPEIFIPQTVMFVGTLNNDHTVRPLTPRVLDRTALVSIKSTTRQSLERAGLEPNAEIENIVDEFNDIMKKRDVGFSVRAAQSLSANIAVVGKEKSLLALDYVMLQEVLSKIKLMASDQQDANLLEELQSWIKKPECKGLNMCREQIGAWQESLEAGQDVFQA